MALLPNSGLETHPDGSGNLNGIVNGNWEAIGAMFNPGEGFTLRQDNGTPGNSGTVLTANGSVFRTGTEFVGAICRFADGSLATISAVVSTTVATASVSADVAVQAFEVYLTGSAQYDALVRGLTKQVQILSADDGKALLWSDALQRIVLSFAGGTNVTLGRVLYGGGANLPPASSADFSWDDSAKLLTITGSKRTTKVDYSDLNTVNSATGSQTPDFGLANNHRFNCTGNITINAPTNVKVGGVYRIIISQDATGGRTVTWNAAFVFPNTNLTTAANGANAITCATFLATASGELVCIANSDGIEEVKATINGIDTLGTSGTVDLDFSRRGWAKTDLSGDITFTTSARGAGRNKEIKILCDGTGRNFTFPGWIFVGGTAPASIAANKTALLKLKCWGTTDGSITAEYSVEP